MLGRRKPGPTGGLAALLILCVASLTLFTIYVKEGETGPLHTVQLGAAEVLSPVRTFVSNVSWPLQQARERVGGVFQDDKREEWKRAVREKEALAAQVARLKQENVRLKNLLDDERPEYRYGPLARVVAPVGDQFTETITIDVGRADGVKAEQPVVSAENALVGRTTGRISEHTAEVMLVTDQKFAAGVRIVPPDAVDPESGDLTSRTTEDGVTYGQGLLMTGWEEYLGVELVKLDRRAEKGDYVVTSGRAGKYDLAFPPGLLIGTVESVSSRDTELYKKIVVSPAVSPDDLEEVRVIFDW
jgi:rod shape-determining protein MreC